MPGTNMQDIRQDEHAISCLSQSGSGDWRCVQGCVAGPGIHLCVRGMSIRPQATTGTHRFGCTTLLVPLVQLKGGFYRQNEKDPKTSFKIML